MLYLTLYILILLLIYILQAIFRLIQKWSFSGHNKILLFSLF